MKHKNYYLATGLLGLLITTAVVGLTSFAAEQPPASQLAPSQFNVPIGAPDLKQHQAIKDAITDDDYGAWSSAMQEQVVTIRQHTDELEAKISQQTFDQLKQIRRMLEDGDKEGARQLMGELGLPGFGPGMHGFKHGLRMGWRHGQGPLPVQQ